MSYEGIFHPTGYGYEMFLSKRESSILPFWTEFGFWYEIENGFLVIVYLIGALPSEVGVVTGLSATDSRIAC